MAEEQRRDGPRSNDDPQWPGPVAQPDPRRQRPQRDTDAEDVVHHADEEDVVVKERHGDERNRRPPAEQAAAQRQRAGHDQDEGGHGESLAGPIDANHPCHRRHDQVHDQVRDDLPFELVVAGEDGIAADLGDDVHARQVVGVVRQRRHQVRPDRHRREQDEHEEQDGNLHPRKCRRTPS